MPFEVITVVAAGAVYSGWESVQIEQSMETIEVNFMLTTSEVTALGDTNQSAFDRWNFPPGTPVEVYANEDLVVSGIVWQYMPQADAEQHTVTIMGKTLSHDFAVSTIKSYTGGNYENTTIQAIIAEWATAHGITFLDRTVGANGMIIGNWQIRQGATNYEESLRMIKPRGLLLFGDPFGAIVLSDGRADGIQGPIVQGENIKRMSARLTDENYNTAEVIGQLPEGTDLKQRIQPWGMAMSDLGRRRLKLLVEPTAIDAMLAQQRAMWEVRRTAGATIQATITVPGWHTPSGESYVPRNIVPIETGEYIFDAPIVSGQSVVYPGTPAVPTITNPFGPLWMLNADTYVYAPWLKIDCVLRTYRVVFSQSLAEGSTTEMTLVDPQAIDTSAAADATGLAPCRSGGVWSVGFTPEDMYEAGAIAAAAIVPR